MTLIPFLTPELPSLELFMLLKFLLPPNSLYINVTRTTGQKVISFVVLVLNVTTFWYKNEWMNESLPLVTKYRLPGLYVNFSQRFWIYGDFNIHSDEADDVLGLAFINSNVTRSTYYLNHTLDLIISDWVDINDIDISPQIDDVTDHYLVSCTLNANKLYEMTSCIDTIYSSSLL